MDDPVFKALARSRFRSRFRLNAADLAYLRGRGVETVVAHGREFVLGRLAPAEPVNDGRQTPMRGHPFFVAQHATATCCRGCLAKWHRIQKGAPLTSAEVDRILEIARQWLEAQLAGAPSEVQAVGQTNLNL